MRISDWSSDVCSSDLWQAIFYVLAGFGVLCLLTAARALPETLTQRASGGVHNVARSYLELLRHRHFMAYALAGGLGSSMMFSYISVSAFVFIDVYHFTPVPFSWLFGRSEEHTSELPSLMRIS